MKLRFCLLLLFSVLSKYGLSQAVSSYYFRHYKDSDFLADNWVMSIAQDSYGFIWFGTHDGLSRFDGYQFRTFRYGENNPNGLGNNHIESLFLSKRNDLYVGTFSGMYVYSPSTETFGLIKGTNAMLISEILESQSGTLYLLAAGKIYSYDT